MTESNLLLFKIPRQFCLGARLEFVYPITYLICEVASIFFQVISAGGSYVLGQEQDQLASNFSANEAFIGQISQLNIWSYELPASDIAGMARHAENFVGNVIGWSDFYDPADAGIKKIEPSVARTGKLQHFSSPTR